MLIANQSSGMYFWNVGQSGDKIRQFFGEAPRALQTFSQAIFASKVHLKIPKVELQEEELWLGQSVTC